MVEKEWVSNQSVSGDPYLIFQSAEAFLNVCRTLQATVEKGNKYVLEMVMAVNSALALELFLKCLRTIESGSFEKGHEFDQQYRDLSLSAREELRARHKRAESSDFFADMRAKKYKTDLDSLLSMGRGTFVHFRYAFEENPAAEKTTWALDGFMMDVRDMILERHPEWTPKGYRPPR